MKTTIDIPESDLQEALRHTGAKTKREAVVTAIQDFNRRRRVERLVREFGRSTDFLTRDELARLRKEP
ncbi:MAG: type II toxin-antitoxin system VapB family antitoxin [Gemmatimonadota bacterium]